MIANLQALRFFAALLVILHHAPGLYLALGGDNEGLARLIGHFGYTGVDVFFVISGFVMSHTTAQRGGPAAARDFVANRLMRIYPTYWILLAVGIGVYWLTDFAPIASKSLLHSFFLTTTRQPVLFLEVAWTLSFELYFYALFAALLLLPKTAVRLSLSAAFALVLAINVVPGAPLQSAKGFLLSPFVLEFLAGALLPGLVRFGRSRLLLAALCVAAAGFYVLGIDIDHRRGMGRVISFGSFSVLAVYIAAAVEAHQIFRAGRWLSLLGSASYAIYLLHLSAIRVIEWSGICPALAPLGGPTAELGYVVILAAISAAGVAVYTFVEKPLLAMLRRAYRQTLAG